MSEALTSANSIGFCHVVAPFLAAAVGWYIVRLIEFLALRPRLYMGLPPFFGWQGYFYTHQQVYLTHWSKDFLDRLTSLQQVFEHISPEKLLHHQLTYLRPQLDTLIDGVMARNNLLLWENLPILMKNRIYARVHRLLPRVMDDIIEELSDSLPRFLTFKDLLEQAESRKPGTIESLYKRFSHPSFRQAQFICATFGLLAGLAQAFVSYHWQVYGHWFWLITATGICFSFYWVAQKILALPLTRIPLIGQYINRKQVIRRQNQELRLAAAIANEILSVENIANALFVVDRSNQIQRVFKRRFSSLVADVDIRTMVQLTMGPVGYLKLKKNLSRALSRAITEPLKDPTFNRERSEQVNLFLQKCLHSKPDAFLQKQRDAIIAPLSILGGLLGLSIGLGLGLFEWLIALI